MIELDPIAAWMALSYVGFMRAKNAEGADRSMMLVMGWCAGLACVGEILQLIAGLLA